MMRTKFLLLSLLCLFTFSCDEDDILIPQDNDEIVLTSTNYIYEGDLRLFYLEFRNTELQEAIEVWEQIPDSDPNYNQAQMDIAEAEEEIESNNTESMTLSSESCLECIGFGGPIIPDPPIPLPCYCFDIFNTIENILLLPNTDSFGYSIIAGNEVLVSTSPNTQLNTYDINQNLSINLQNFILTNPDFNGEATVNIQSNDLNYSIPVYLQNP